MGGKFLENFVDNAFLVPKIQRLKKQAEKYDRGMGPHSFLDGLSDVNLDQIALERTLKSQKLRVRGVYAVALISAIGTLLLH